MVTWLRVWAPSDARKLVAHGIGIAVTERSPTFRAQAIPVSLMLHLLAPRIADLQVAVTVGMDTRRPLTLERHPATSLQEQAAGVAVG
ncbi:hypothetical protein N7454_001231 [Penicillium verhagenii]|nr:hypothetical protein N7454_001231 [Penicillium verhagenii]